MGIFGYGNISSGNPVFVTTFSSIRRTLAATEIKAMHKVQHGANLPWLSVKFTMANLPWQIYPGLFIMSNLPWLSNN
jgi:hypothetical protein